MPTIAPPSITTLPTAPDPNNRATFNTLAYPWSASLPTFSMQVSALGTNVKANADDAATSATTAATQAGIAATSANTATTQAGAATTQANASSTSAGASEASRIAASRLNLGNKATAPTLDNQGAALLAGATYYDTGVSKWRVWSGTAWVDGISAIAGVTSINGLTGPVTGIATTAANTFTATQEWATGANIASAATVNLDATTGNRAHITGVTTITAVTLTRGPRTVIFDGILTLAHNATSNNLPGAVNITTAVGDRAIYESDGATVYCVSYIKSNGASVVSSSAGAGGTTASGSVTLTAASPGAQTITPTSHDQYVT